MAAGHEDRRPLPTREQIGAIDDAGLLRALIDDVQSVADRIEVDLEFGSAGDATWEGRALAALAMHRGCIRRLKERLAEVETKQVVATSSKETERTKRTALSIIEGVSFSRAFMDAAKASLAPVTYALIVAGAQDLQSTRVIDGARRLSGEAA